MSISMTHVCLFRIADIVMCLPIAQVQQVFESAEYQPVPLAPAAILGLVNLRGLVVTAIDLRVVLGMDACPHDEASNIVASCGGRVLSLRVDEVISVEEVAELDPVQAPPANLGASLRALARGVVDTPEGIALLVDIEAIAEAARPMAEDAQARCR